MLELAAQAKSTRKKPLAGYTVLDVRQQLLQLNTEMVIFELLKKAGTDEFRAILPL